MEIGVLIIPALGGYLLLTNTYATSFVVYRESGYHLIFRSVIAGLILFAISYSIVGIVSLFFSSISVPYIDDSLWSQSLSLIDLGAFVLSLLLGMGLPYLINRFYPSEQAIEKVLKKEGSQTELMLREAVDTEELVELSLKNGKSYVGIVVAFDVLPRDNKQDVAIFPVIEYEDKDTFRLLFDKDGGEMVVLRVAMPMSEIAAVSLWSRKAEV